MHEAQARAGDARPSARAELGLPARASRALRTRGVAAALAVGLLGCGEVVTLQLPTIEELEASPRDVALPSVVLDADGDQLATLRHEFREPVSLTEVPKHLVDAVLIAEDQRFYDHGGVDARSLLRAGLVNAAAGEVNQGGSTITQQLIKELYLTDAPRTPETKVKEALLARQLERELPKATILETYLNTVYLGAGAYGIGAAAWTYFRSDVSDLDVHESALLAAIIRAPEAFAPTRAHDEALSRRDDVLWRMAAAGHLTVEERNAATARPIEVHGRPPAPETREPHLVDLVVRTLLADASFGASPEDRAARLYGGGLRIHTTVRADLQEAARQALAEHLPDPGDPEAAIAAVDPRTGHVLAAVGNRTYEQLQYDLPSQARRQPGSTYKTYVLAAALADGWHPDDRLDGRQGTIRTAAGSWEVNNYDRRSYPGVSLTGATRASVNAAFARLGVEVGIGRVAALSRAMGVASPVPEDVQITIGGGALGVTPLDMAAGYATIGNLGAHVPTTVISRIEDAQGRTVWLPDTEPRQVLSTSAAFLTAEVLQEAVENGTGMAARVDGWQIAGKTGTTSSHADAWFVGTTPVLSTAVWVGRAEGQVPLVNVQGVPRVTGGTIPARIFSTFVTDALSDVAPVPFELPGSEYVVVEVDPRTGLLGAPWCPGEVQRVLRILAPSDVCPRPPPPPPPPPEPEPAEDDEGEDDGEAGEGDEAEPGEGDDETEPAEPEVDAGDGDETDDGDEPDDGDDGQEGDPSGDQLDDG